MSLRWYGASLYVADYVFSWGEAFFSWYALYRRSARYSFDLLQLNWCRIAELESLSRWDKWMANQLRNSMSILDCDQIWTLKLDAWPEHLILDTMSRILLRNLEGYQSHFISRQTGYENIDVVYIPWYFVVLSSCKSLDESWQVIFVDLIKIRPAIICWLLSIVNGELCS